VTYGGKILHADPCCACCWQQNRLAVLLIGCLL